ncbi:MULTISPECIES: hypothetical protein [Muribaculaceae]|uniref:Uncharacterized protein n=2 Tax=Muribaculaceae TaxID=2005473 RepID=A0A4Z0V3M9_9BACT|nr:MULTISPECIES: hypothetical protein [Muribaculaceae]QCD37182.1 hypothetical protein E7746_14680 [Muribaculum gordoncarteri]TGG35107.1 hypothetical protein EZ315_15595 [Duncaniella freteri]
MDNRQFFDLVRRMRVKQRDYFKYHRKSDLAESKRIEAQVDAEISRVERLLGLPDAIPQAPSIFDYPNDKTP